MDRDLAAKLSTMKVQNIKIIADKMVATVTDTHAADAELIFQEHLDSNYDDEWMVMRSSVGSKPGEIVIECSNIS